MSYFIKNAACTTYDTTYIPIKNMDLQNDKPFFSLTLHCFSYSLEKTYSTLLKRS